MNVLALDLSLRSTGVAMPDGTTTRWQPKSMGTARLADLESRLYAAIKPAPDLVVLEDYAHAAAQGAHQIGELGGVIRLALHRRRIPHVEVAPASLKLYATGKGNASKDDVLVAAVRINAPVANNDEADAWWLWAMALDRYGVEQWPVPPKNRTALDKVEWPSIEGIAA